MEWKAALFWSLPMLHQHGRRLSRRKIPRRAPLGDPTVSIRLLALLILTRQPAAALEKDPIVLPALYPAVQTRIPIPLDLGPDRVHPPRRGEDAYSC